MDKHNISYDEFAALNKNLPDTGDEPLFEAKSKEEQYIYGLGYGEFTALNTHMIQKAFKEIENLKKEIKLLKNNIV